MQRLTKRKITLNTEKENITTPFSVTLKESTKTVTTTTTLMPNCSQTDVAGNYQEALHDAEAGRKLQPRDMKAIERGNFQSLV